MIQVLTILRAMVTRHPMALPVIGFGIVLLAIDVLVLALTAAARGPRFSVVWLLLAGFWVALMFRELVSNRVLSLAPGFRRAAVGALLSVALLASLVACGIAAISANPVPLLPVAFLTFAIASVLLLLWQWLVTLRVGYLLAMGSLIGCWLLIAASNAVAQLLPWSWAAAIAAMAGWFWLDRGMQRPVLDRTAIGQRHHRRGSQSEKPAEDSLAARLWPRIDAASLQPDLTLLRGMRANWRNRAAATALTFAGVATMGAILSLLLPSGGRNYPSSSAIIMTMSFGGISYFVATLSADWPARLRLLWLRAAGDRNGLWQTLERTLIGDVAIILGAATLTAALLHAFADVSRSVLVIYVAGCAIGPIFAGYFTILRRAQGAGLRGLRFLSLLVFMFTIILGPRTLGAMGVAPLVCLLAIFGLLTFGCRYLAHRRLLRMDWCAIKPARADQYRTL